MSVISRFTGLFRSRRLASEVSEELRAHLEMRTEQNIATGMSPADARRDALLRFGNPALIQEDTRRSDILPWLDSLAQDARYAARLLRKHPGFTSVAIITLALGIGANTAVFTVLRAVLLRSLPFPEPQRLVRIDEVNSDPGRAGMLLKGVSPPDLLAFREQNQTFEQIGGFTNGSAVLSESGEPRRVPHVNVTTNLFAVLGVRPSEGREFASEQEVAGSAQVAIVSYSLAQSLRNPLGRVITLEGEGYTIVGVMPRGFQFPLGQDPDAVWTPLPLARDPKLRSANYVEVIGRLRPGVTPAQAKGDLDVILARAVLPAGMGGKNWTARVANLKDDLTAGSRLPLGILAAAVALVLLIAAANVAGLCLSRSAARQKEIAVRLALGCSRARLFRQLTVESLLLALLGGVAGLLLARWSAHAMLAIAPTSLLRIAPAELDGVVLAFAAALSVIAGFAAGALPAWRAAGFDVNRAMKEGNAAFRPGKQPLHAVFAVVQLALATLLLCGAALMLRTMARLAAVDPGFQPQGILTAQISPPHRNYKTNNAQAAFCEQLISRIAALPNVGAAAATSAFPMGGTRMVFRLVVSNPGQPEINVISLVSSVTPEYFRALGIPLLRGRLFTAADNPDSQPVALVSRSLARQRWGNDDPIGKTIPNGFTPRPPVVIGVVEDVHQDALDHEPGPQLYLPFAQRPWPFMQLVVRSRSGDAVALAPELRGAVHALDPRLTLDQLMPAESLLARSVMQRRFYMLLLAIFAALALALAAVGVFGMMAYSVTQRTREIGVRMALGASRERVVAMVLRRTAVLTMIALTIGLTGSLALTQLLRSLLFEIKPRDPLSFALAAAVLAATALLASALPARRASRIDPNVALRYE